MGMVSKPGGCLQLCRPWSPSFPPFLLVGFWEVESGWRKEGQPFAPQESSRHTVWMFSHWLTRLAREDWGGISFLHTHDFLHGAASAARIQRHPPSTWGQFVSLWLAKEIKKLKTIFFIVWLGDNELEVPGTSDLLITFWVASELSRRHFLQDCAKKRKF